MNVVKLIEAVFGKFKSTKQPLSPEDQQKQEARTKRNTPSLLYSFLPINHLSRQQTRRNKFVQEFNTIRARYGAGKNAFSYGGELTRRGARNIARSISKRTV